MLLETFKTIIFIDNCMDKIEKKIVNILFISISAVNKISLIFIVLLEIYYNAYTIITKIITMEKNVHLNFFLTTNPLEICKH